MPDSDVADQIANIAQEVELEMGDALADLTMISRLISTSQEWSDEGLPANAIGKPLRIALAGRWLGGWSKDQWRERLSGFDSPAFRTLTQQWIVSTFTRWEEIHRKRLIALGEPGNSDLFGDLRRLRIDIVHHRDAIATAGNAGKCKILTRFTPGTTIFLSPDDFVTILDELAKWVESLGGTPQGRVHRDPEGRHK